MIARQVAMPVVEKEVWTTCSVLIAVSKWSFLYTLCVGVFSGSQMMQNRLEKTVATSSPSNL